MVNGFMKAMYRKPELEVMRVKPASQMMAISGPEGIKEGGANDGSHKPRAPKAF